MARARAILAREKMALGKMGWLSLLKASPPSLGEGGITPNGYLGISRQYFSPSPRTHSSPSSFRS